MQIEGIRVCVLGEGVLQSDIALKINGLQTIWNTRQLIKLDFRTEKEKKKHFLFCWTLILRANLFKDSQFFSEGEFSPPTP